MLWPGGQPSYNPAEHLDLRGEAITTCAVWAEARDAFLKAPPAWPGLLGRSKLVSLARALEARVAPTRAEHPDAYAARLACLDWIAYTVSRASALLTRKNARFLDRFVWGYLESTREFLAFFEARKVGARITTPLAASLPATRQCLVGCAYGAPSLAALMRGTGGVRGRGRWPVIFIDDEAYAVLGKNRAASRLLWMEAAGAQRGQDGLLHTAVAEQLVEMSDLGRPGHWPALIVQRADGPRYVLHLAIGRRGAGRAGLGSDPQWWMRTQGSLMEVLTERQRWGFAPVDDDGSWGSFEQLLWHLTVVQPGARTHRKLFSNLPAEVA
jgi:hypothetical protein